MDESHVSLTSEHITFHMSFRNSHYVRICAGEHPTAPVNVNITWITNKQMSHQ